MMQQAELRRSKSWRQTERTKSNIPVRKYSTDKKHSCPQLMIRSLSDLDDLRDLKEFVSMADVVEDSPVGPDTVTSAVEDADETEKTQNAAKVCSCNAEVAKADISTGNVVKCLVDTKNAAAVLKAKSCPIKDLKLNEVIEGKKSGLSKLSSINENHIDDLTGANEEVIRSSNKHMPEGIPKSKSTDAVVEGRIKKSGVQLKRCLSLYDRKRNPHFCKDTVLEDKGNYSVRYAFGSAVKERIMKEDKLNPKAYCQSLTSAKSPRINNKQAGGGPYKMHKGQNIGKTEEPLNDRQKNKMHEKAHPRSSIASDLSEETDRTSTITSLTAGSMMSSTLSLESGSSSDLDFDALVPIETSSRDLCLKSPRQSLIPKPIRPRSATLCIGENIIKDNISDVIKEFRQGRRIERSISLYGKRVSSFGNGSSVSIKIHESIKSLSSSESSCDSTDDVSLGSPRFTKEKAVDVPVGEDGYPDPLPPSTSRSDVFNPREYVQVDEHALKAPNELASSFNDLLAYLLKDLSSDLAKVRAIYRWIVSQTVPLTLTRRDVASDSPMEFLYNIRARRASYSELMAVMCRKAGIQCVIINGMAKGVAYDVGDKVTHRKMSNSWNAVYVDSTWRFIHPYWASQAASGYSTGRWAISESDAFHTDNYTESSHQFTQKLNDFYFLTDPDKFITKCFPDDPRWQLLRKHITKSEFEGLPFLQPAFYELKLKTRSHHQSVITAVNGKVEISLEFPKDKIRSYKFRYKLYVQRDLEAEGEYGVILLDRYLLYYHEENIANFEIRFPVSGIYKLELHCSDSKKQLPSDWVCDYKIICKERMETCNPLPVVPSIGWGPGEELSNAGLECLTHTSAIFSLDKESVTFIRFALPKDKEVALEAELLHIDKSSLELQSHVACDQDGEHATIQISPPSVGEYALQVYAASNLSDERENVCNFLMHRTKLIEDPECSDIRQNLMKAIEDGDVEALAYWIERFTEKGMADTGDLAVARRTLQVAKLNRDIEEAIARKDLDLLERTMNSISGTSLKRQLGSHVTAKAEAMRSRLRRLKRLRHAVLEMDQKTISEMRSYPKPPQAVHGVMAATFLLLGNKESELKKWKRVQGLISKRGKEGLKRRVAEFTSSVVTPAVLKRAKEILTKYDLEAVQIASAGAATFYQWAITMVGEVENDLGKVDSNQTI